MECRETWLFLQAWRVVDTEGGGCECVAAAVDVVVDGRARVVGFAFKAGAEIVFLGQQQGFSCRTGQGTPDERRAPAWAAGHVK